jgi:ABC-type transport system substrate-binding protein
LERPDPNFLIRLGATPTWVVPSEAVVAERAAWAGVPQGGGPFRFTDWQARSRLVLDANPLFNTRPAVDRLEFLIVPDPATALNMYRSGELDIAPVSASQLGGITQDPVLRAELQRFAGAALIFMGLNARRVPATADVRVRQAFAHAIDRRALADRVLFGAWTPATGIVPRGVPGYDGGLGAEYDPDRARRLMSQAGYPDGRGFPRLQLAVAAEYHSTAAEAVAAQLAANLGVRLDVRRLEPGDMYTSLREGRFDAFLSGWTADYLSAEQWLYTLLHRDADSNFVRYDNPRFMGIVDAAMSAATPEAQEPLWREANGIATGEAGLIPLAYAGFTFLVKPTVSGFVANLFGLTAFQSVRRTAVTPATDAAGRGVPSAPRSRH